VGLGFAIPIERAMRVARELRANGRVRRGWLGLDLAGPQAGANLRRRPGLSVRRVAPASPGERAGLKAGDVLRQINQRPLRSFLDWEGAVLDVAAGDTVSVTVHRGERDRALTLLAVELPSETAPRVAALRDLQLITVTPAIQGERQLRNDRGALVVSAGPESQRHLGLQPGDVVLQINAHRITAAEQVNQVISYYAGRGPIRLFFERGGQIGYTDFWVR
jgi:serine protease Do